MLKTYRPDFFISGVFTSFRTSPEIPGEKNIGKTAVISPGQVPGAQIPNHVILELPSGEGDGFLREHKIDKALPLVEKKSLVYPGD